MDTTKVFDALDRKIERMVSRRPFGSADTLQRAAHQEWFSLSREDWLEAIGHHPRVGDRDALRARFAGSDAGV